MKSRPAENVSNAVGSMTRNLISVGLADRADHGHLGLSSSPSEVSAARASQGSESLFGC